jgi:SAM-dependent methyltransferase
LASKRRAGKVMVMTMSDAQEHWEQRYREHGRFWSGRVNRRLAEIAEPLTPGRALDLGCGEGGDAVWLAEHGWQVTAVDIAQTALDRAAELAAERGMADRIEFQRHDLPDTFPDGTFDLVSAQFLHSLMKWDRPALLRRAAASVTVGGLLVIVDHGAVPPWSEHLKEHPDLEFPSADEVIASLALDDGWETLRAEAVDRDATGPDGQPAHLQDNVMVLRRNR